MTVDVKPLSESRAATSRARRNQSGNPLPWDRRAAETAKAYAAFRTYCEMGACRSVREALRQNSGVWEAADVGGLVFQRTPG